MGRNSRIGRTRIELGPRRRRSGALAVMGALAVVAAAVFALGLELGRRNEPVERARPADPLTLLDAAENIAPPAPPPAKLVFHEALTNDRPVNTQAQVAARTAPGKHVVRALAAKAAAPTPTPAAAEQGPSAPSVAPPEAARSRGAPTATPTPTPTATPSAQPSRGGWEIQLVASPDQAEAQRIASRHPGARVVAADVDGKRWYRVRLAGFDSRVEAQAGIERLGRDAGRAFVASAP